MSNVADGAPKKSWFARHKILTGILALFLFFIVIGMIGSSGGSSTPSPQTGSSDTNTTAEEAAPAPAAKIGDTVTDKDMAFTVTGVTTAKSLGNSFTRKDSQGTFNIVTVKIENKSKETKTIDSSMLQIVDSQGRTFDRSVDGQSAKGLSEGGLDLFLQQVQPGLSVTGEIVFDLPADATGLQLIVKGSYFSSGQKIQLGQ